jgi:hypothetical protein
VQIQGALSVFSSIGCYSLAARFTVTQGSDIRLKDNIETVISSIEKIMRLRGVYYTRKDDPGPRHVGVIAQEIEEILPEVVFNDGPTKSVAYGNIVGLLIEGMKAQQAIINRLDTTVAALLKKYPL